MKANQTERLRRNKEFEVNQNRWRKNQIETMISEFERICIDLGHQIEAEYAGSDLRPDSFCLSNICEGSPRAPREASAVSRCAQD